MASGTLTIINAYINVSSPEYILKCFHLISEHQILPHQVLDLLLLLIVLE